MHLDCRVEQQLADETEAGEIRETPPPSRTNTAADSYEEAARKLEQLQVTIQVRSSRKFPKVGGFCGPCRSR